MQQTQKYKLNLIESSDPFLPDGLNANTRKVEKVLSENLGTMQGAVDTLDQRLATAEKNLGVGGKNCRIAWGSYTGTGMRGAEYPNSLTFGFAPAAVWITCSRTWEGFLVRGAETAVTGPNPITGSNGYYTCSTSWWDGGVSWYADTDGAQLNITNRVYYYVAIGYDKNAG